MEAFNKTAGWFDCHISMDLQTARKTRFNIGRYLGHPLGHPKDHVDPRYPYLMDHHIYRDPRFVLKAAVYQDPNTDEIILQTENLKKYSWNEALREKYINKGYPDP